MGKEDVMQGQWKTTQLQKRMKICHLPQHGWFGGHYASEISQRKAITAPHLYVESKTQPGNIIKRLTHTHTENKLARITVEKGKGRGNIEIQD